MNRIFHTLLVILACQITMLHGQQRCMAGSDNAALTAFTQEAIMERERQIQSWIQQNAIYPRETITIPVVFHVLYYTQEENVSARQIQSQVDALNRDMNASNNGASRIPEEWQDLAESMDIRFCLASRDPEGNTASGITRKQTDVPDFGLQMVSGGRRAVFYSQFGGQDAWDQERYVNIWIVRLGGFLGFASFPDMIPFPEEDGILISPEGVGTLGIAQAPYNEGHTLTHEMGHYFNLYHLWGLETGCGEDDFVDDTPLQENGNIRCPVHPHISCDSPDMFMNFMDITYDGCMALFTPDQRARLHANLHIYRPGLIQASPPCISQEPGDHVLAGIDVYYAPVNHLIVASNEIPMTQQVRLRIYSIDGKLSYTSPWDSGYLQIVSTAGWPGGVYAVELETANDRRTQAVIVY